MACSVLPPPPPPPHMGGGGGGWRGNWGGRLDLDLLALGDQILPDLDCYLCWQDLTLHQQKITAPSELILPHPRLHERSFVLVPLADIAPDWRHPVRKRSVVQMLGDLLPAEVGAVLAGKLID